MHANEGVQSMNERVEKESTVTEKRIERSIQIPPPQSDAAHDVHFKAENARREPGEKLPDMVPPREGACKVCMLEFNDKD